MKRQTKKKKKNYNSKKEDNKEKDQREDDKDSNAAAVSSQWSEKQLPLQLNLKDLESHACSRKIITVPWVREQRIMNEHANQSPGPTF